MFYVIALYKSTFTYLLTYLLTIFSLFCVALIK